MAFVEPRCRHRAAEVLERAGVAAVCLCGGEDHLGVDGHLGLGALEAVPRHQLVVVQDRAVVDAGDRAVTDRVVVRGDLRMALRVVADVQEDLVRIGRDRDLVEDGARAGLLLVDGQRASGGAEGVPDRVGAALGDRGQQRLGSARPVDAALRTDAVSRNATHWPLPSIVVRRSGNPGDGHRHSDDRHDARFVENRHPSVG